MITHNKKWSDLSYDDFYIPWDENRKAVLGYFLTTLDIDLERLPNNLFEPFGYFPSQKNVSSGFRDGHIEKIYLKDIVGTSYDIYSSDNQLIYSFAKLKRIAYYIAQNRVTRTKYMWMLKRRAQDNYIQLSQNTDGTYFVDGNGNHRVITYKIMMLAEIAKKYPYVYEPHYNINFSGFWDIKKKYWLYAKINN